MRGFPGENYDRNCGYHHPGTTFHGIERVIASEGWNGKQGTLHHRMPVSMEISSRIVSPARIVTVFGSSGLRSIP